MKNYQPIPLSGTISFSNNAGDILRLLDFMWFREGIENHRKIVGLIVKECFLRVPLTSKVTVRTLYKVLDEINNSIDHENNKQD